MIDWYKVYYGKSSRQFNKEKEAVQFFLACVLSGLQCSIVRVLTIHNPLEDTMLTHAFELSKVEGR